MPVTIRPYQSEDQEAFQQLNLEWIEAYFEPEPEDVIQLGDPQSHIIDGGGAVIVAEQDGQVIGTVGLVLAEDGKTMELVKMAVHSSARGQGVGTRLIKAAKQQARQMGATAIWLETNSILEQAVRLYKKHGFRELPPEQLIPTPYDRCNYQMRIDLDE